MRHFSNRLCGATVARPTPDRKAACSNHVRVKRFFAFREYRSSPFSKEGYKEKGHLKDPYRELKKIRNRQDSNLRSQRESDFESDALTSRPRLLSQVKGNGEMRNHQPALTGIERCLCD